MQAANALRSGAAGTTASIAKQTSLSCVLTSVVTGAEQSPASTKLS